MKKTIIFILPLMVIGCSNPKKVWREDGKNFTTIEEFIDEFGEPVYSKKFEDSTEEWDNEIREYKDRFSNKLSNQDLLRLIREWNEITIKQTFETFKEEIRKPPYKLNWDDYITSKEYEWLEENLPYTNYSETNRDRLNRSKFLSENLDFPLFWSWWIYSGTLEQVKENGLVYNRERNNNGVNLIGTPPKPEYKEQYNFFLYKSKYGDDYNDKMLPDDTEMKNYGRVYIDWDNNIVFNQYDTYDKYENPYTICDCLDNSDLVNNSLCKKMFRDKYGVTVTDSDNIQYEVIKKDYEINCK